MEHTILYGNGLNLLGGNKISWNNLLCDLSKQANYNLHIGDKPYTMVYEELLLAGNLNEAEIKEFIITKLRDYYGANSFYDMMRDLNLHNYLTTNYEFNLEKSFENNGLSYSNNKLEDIYSIRSFVEIASNETTVSKIWHIHGDIDRTKSISLGLNHYCGTIGKMDGYFKGTYEYVSNGNKVRLNALSKKLKNKMPYDGVSWIELFFTTTVHIVGLSLDYSETDLWWLLNRRARPITFNLKDIRNRIIYYDTESDKEKATCKEQLLRAFNVEYKHFPATNNDWKGSYSKIFEEINSLR